MGYVECLGQIPEETAHVLQNLVSANGLRIISYHTTYTLMTHNCMSNFHVINPP